MKTAAQFSVSYHQFLNAKGALAEPPPGLDLPALVPVYRTMAFTRAFDARAVALQRTGQLRTFPSSLGEEAATVGLASVMRPDDVLLPTYRETGAFLWRGVTPVEIFLYWAGDERGSAIAGPRGDFPISVPIASHCGHATGVAAAFQYRKEARVAVCVLGDGATSKGDFYEAVNLAGVWRLPAVFVVINNRWAISVPAARQTACATFAQKAIAGGVPGVQADGNDAVAVRHVVGQALERARSGEGPTVVELLSYRLTDHTTADDARRYRSADEVSAAWAEEPLARLRALLAREGLWTKADEEALIADNQARLEAAVADYLATPPQPLTSMVDYLYAELPAELVAQRAELAAREGGHHG
ncbi:pyruvate dehydrogenase (acetyl-transferring) E1 component subunit alpha [Crenobacter luteus]|uniref:Pyruvate dehydrogenase E1 component subunit alpha n=1 Tax=Crenobacter luteus TaxID=1452487 RepID=A0A161S4F9_9NEIS|nr:pyruvate dehydrogenase (acetyl-transferring) E1 component subunit alpha [Crenobacter luteus]KZE25942.1 pyruvate dehydrogenase (acetyl-transferring) E1 component subunit alpha [Crenobacter luteus]